jgi:hypothetical protein
LIITSLILCNRNSLITALWWEMDYINRKSVMISVILHHNKAFTVTSSLVAGDVVVGNQNTLITADLISAVRSVHHVISHVIYH